MSSSIFLGDRDIVGHGYNGQREYMDDIDCPFPAIRFRSNSDETAALRVKEKGDWKNLSVDEKKARKWIADRYRYSYISLKYGFRALGIRLLVANLQLIDSSKAYVKSE